MFEAVDSDLYLGLGLLVLCKQGACLLSELTVGFDWAGSTFVVVGPSWAGDPRGSFPRLTSLFLAIVAV